MFVALCLFMVAGALAQVPIACRGPQQFEGRFQRYDKERRFAVRGAMVYDGPNRRIREIADVTLNSTRAVYDKLKLYNENKEYTIDVKTKKCNVTTPRHPFHPYGVPEGGKFMAEAVIGAAGVAGESVTVADFSSRQNNSGFFSIVTEPDCFPVHDAFFSPDGLEVVNFYDLQSGISDPDAFRIPAECTGL